MSDKSVQHQIENLRQMVEERHCLYGERYESQRKIVEFALSAIEKQTAIQLEAQKESVRKAELAQERYNETHNNLLHRMDKQNEDFVSRREYLVAHDDLRRELSALRETQAIEDGKGQQIYRDKEQSNWSTGVWVAIIIAALGWIVGLIAVLLPHLH